MTLKELSEDFNFQDIAPLLEEHYPLFTRYLNFYVTIFDDIDEEEFDDEVNKKGYVVKMSKVKVKSIGLEGEYHTLSQASLYTKNGFICTNPSFEQCIFSKIDYKTMEFYSDEEIFIRCLHGIFLKFHLDEILKDQAQERKKIPNTKKNDKGK
jgi:hypothetical protein